MSIELTNTVLVLFALSVHDDVAGGEPAVLIVQTHASAYKRLAIVHRELGELCVRDCPPGEETACAGVNDPDFRIPDVLHVNLRQ